MKFAAIALCVFMAGLAQGQTTRPTTRPTQTRYLGRPVSTAWVNDKYREFGDKINFRDGKFEDIGKDVAIGGMVSSQPPQPGAFRITGSSSIIQVIGEDRAIVSRPDTDSTYGATFMLSGLSGALLDEMRINKRVIYEGSYKYTSVADAEKTIGHYSVYYPLTRDQFCDALNSGFQLVRWEFTVENDKPNYKPHKVSAP